MDVVFNTDIAIFNYRVAGVWIKNGHVLLHRDVNEEIWSLPGGRVKLAEDSTTSIIREFQEELGLDIRIERLAWVVENFFEYRGKDFHEIGMYYLVSSEINSFEFINSPFYGNEGERLIYQWIPITELQEVELYPEFLRTALTKLPLATEHLIAKQ
ncbi:NUDIX domain-containing protein [Robertmurraya yapensis]|uniref:NUDIX domain-containing protein n=2 Tax=Bacillaceae TaxID=186817 RepID=A0A3S0KMY4_9BACI|nr:NUDIX hydrolase [Bacillus yapensis]RTR34042.1 NUDIX domain-containing protein [Bacillus yapensis]TKS97360.1 NUDIX domain-containing protein [Bacillus yapensis]